MPEDKPLPYFEWEQATNATLMYRRVVELETQVADLQQRIGKMERYMNLDCWWHDEPTVGKVVIA